MSFLISPFLGVLPRREWHNESGDDADGLDALLGLLTEAGEPGGEGEPPEEGAVPDFVVGTSLYPTICALNHSCDPNCKSTCAAAVL